MELQWNNDNKKQNESLLRVILKGQINTKMERTEYQKMPYIYIYHTQCTVESGERIAFRQSSVGAIGYSYVKIKL